MPRPRTSDAKREQFLPEVAATFAELGYRRTTTAALAARLGVRENVLYRLWDDKKTMFLATIQLIYESTIEDWQQVLDDASPDDAPATLLQYAADHYGETGLYRIVFAGISETDDPDIRAALQQMFGRFHAFIERQLGDGRDTRLDAWGFVALGIFSDLCRELGLMESDARRALLLRIGTKLLDR